jgi:hypothetical protein
VADEGREWIFMKRCTPLILGFVLGMLSGCEEAKPTSPEPVTCAPKCIVGIIVKYQSMEPELRYNQFRKQNGLWQQYHMTLETSAGIRLSLTCEQWRFSDIPDTCGQRLQPNEKVWTRPGASTSEESIWVYTNDPEVATFWVISAKEAK